MLAKILSYAQGKETDRRVDAFFSCIPMAYCGFLQGQDPIWSAEFTQLLGLDTIRTIDDIQKALTPSDAAALEGLYIQLKDHQEHFTLNCTVEATGTCLRLFGRIGTQENNTAIYHILWAQDISQDVDKKNELHEKIETADHDITVLNAVLDHLPIPVWARNLSEKLTYCNQIYANWVGQERDKALENNTPLPLTLQKDSLQFENRGRIIIDGKRHIIDVVERNAAEAAIQVGFVVDGTEEERLETELKRQHRATQELLGNLSSAIAVFAADTSLEFYNQAFSNLWDLKESWLNNKPQLGLIMEQLREERKLPEQADFRSYKKSWVDLFTSLLEPKQDMLYLPDGRALRMLTIPHPMGGLMMTFEDVTSRLELESSYNTLIAVQRETLDNLGEGVAVFGSNGQIRLWNPAYLKLWNLDEQALANQPHVSSLVALKQDSFGKKQDWDAMRNKLISFALERREKWEELTLGNGKHLECVTATLPDGGMMVTYRDITTSIQAEQALTERNSALQAADNLKSEFLANVSYQLRTPLNAIMGFSEILTNEFFGKLNPKQGEYTAGITEAGQRLTSLIDDILDLSSIEAGKLELDITQTPIQAMIDDLYEIAKDWAAREGLKTKLVCDEDIGLADIDDKRVKQAMLNLLRNAIAFTPRGGRITISAENGPKNTIILSIEDTGVGMNEVETQDFLKPFTRGETQSGTGLGLTIVQHMTQLHKGTMDVTSAPDKGTKITLTLPRKYKA